MEPTFVSAASVSTVTPGLAAQIDAAVAALPTAHRLAPTVGEIVESKAAAFERLQNWAFTHHFALVIESANARRVLFQCTHHKKKTQNTRKTEEADRIRVQTKTQTRSCLFGVYINKQKRLGD